GEVHRAIRRSQRQLRVLQQLVEPALRFPRLQDVAERLVAVIPEAPDVGDRALGILRSESPGNAGVTAKELPRLRLLRAEIGHGRRSEPEREGGGELSAIHGQAPLWLCVASAFRRKAAAVEQTRTLRASFRLKPEATLG